MPFDYEGAKEAGFTDQQIAEHLAPKNDFDLSGALSSGFGYEDIVPHLLSKSNDPEEPTTLGQVGETLKAIPRGFARSLLTAGEGAGELADAVTNKIGLENLIDSGDDNALVSAARQGQKALNESWLGVDDAYQDAWMTKFGEGLGSMASFLTPGGALKLAGIGGRAAQLGATATLAAPIGSGEGIQRVDQARAEGIEVSEAQEDAAVLFGAAIGLTELAPVDRLLRGLDPNKLSDDLIVNIMQRLSSAMGSGGLEALQETSASLMQDLAEREIYNPDLQLGQEAWDSFTVGGAVGFTADLVLNAMGVRRNRDSRETQEADELQKRAEEEENAKVRRRRFESVESLQGEPVAEEVIDPATIVPKSDNMANHAKDIAVQMGRNFPTETSFNIEQISIPVDETTSEPAFQVVDSEGQSYGSPLREYEQAAVLAGTLNREIVDQTARNSTEEIVEGTPEQYDEANTETLEVIGNRIKNPRSNEITADALNVAADTTVDQGFDEGLSADQAMQRNMGRVFTEQDMVNSLTASQRVNRKRLAQGMPETNTFTVTEAREVLGKDFGRLGDIGAGGIIETQKYSVAKDKKGNPVVVSSLGEVINSKSVQKLRQKDGKPYTQKRKLKTESDARILADRLNSRYDKAVDEVVFEDIKAGNEEIKALLERKNIPNELDSPAIKTMAKAFVGKENVNDMDTGEKKFFYQKIRKLPVVPSPLAEGLPDFDQASTLTQGVEVDAEPLALPAPESVVDASGRVLPSEELVADMQERLNAELKRKNLSNQGVTGRIFQEFRDYGLNKEDQPVFTSEVMEETEGGYLKDFNEIAVGVRQALQFHEENTGTKVDMNDGDAVFAVIKDVLNHETVHALRRLDLFTEAEYKVLEKAAENTKRQGEDITYLAEAQARYADLKLTRTQIMEEAVAELVRQNTNLGGRPRTIINKIKDILEAIARFISGSPPTVQDIVAGIESGDIGARAAGEVRTLRATRDRLNLYEYESIDDVAPAGSGRGTKIGNTSAELERQLQPIKEVTVAEIDEQPIARSTKSNRKFIQAFVDKGNLILGEASYFPDGRLEHKNHFAHRKAERGITDEQIEKAVYYGNMFKAYPDGKNRPPGLIFRGEDTTVVGEVRGRQLIFKTVYETKRSPQFNKRQENLQKNHWAGDDAIAYSRRKTIPKKTVKAYKLFSAKPSKPDEYFPLFVLADKSVPVGEWVTAKSGKRTKEGGVKSGIGELAYRPGWHAGDYASATHIGGKSRGKQGETDYRKADQIWVEVEMADDVDWQSEANQRARIMNNGQPDVQTAHITDQIPKGGFYRYKTNPDMQGNWLIGGDMKINRVLNPEEVKNIGQESGIQDLPLLPELIEQEGLSWNDLGGTAKTELKRFYPEVHARMAPQSEQRKRPTAPRWFQDSSIAYSRRRRGKTGQYIGGPRGLDSPQKLAALRKNVKKLAEEGDYGKFWYERSGKQILDLVGGDVNEADKLIQAIAVTSAQTPVAANFDYALQAYYQNKAGKPIFTGKTPKAQSKKLNDIYAGKPWEGRKTNNFYNNLMRVIDPTRSQGVTTDLWMMRAFGYFQDSPSDAQYDFVEEETARLADQLGWEPQQVQAAIWVALKSKAESKPVKAKTEEKSISNKWMKYKTRTKPDGKVVKERVILDKEKHAKNWLEQSLKHTPTLQEKEAAKFDYADAAVRQLGQISWESIPGDNTNHMMEMFDADYPVLQEYHVEVSKAFLDDQGNDIIATELGMLSPMEFEAPGHYEGKVSPGSQTGVTIPKEYKVDFEASPEGKLLMDAYSAAKGILLKQKAMGYHKPFFRKGLPRNQANGVLIDIGRPFTEAETMEMGRLLSDLAGHGEFNPIGDINGARLINFTDGSNKQFQDIVNTALRSIEFDGNPEVVGELFYADTGYLENNWEENKNGEGYLENGLGGQPDLQRKVRDIVTLIQPRIEAVEEEFSNKYGWKRNPELNRAYRQDTTAEIAPQLEIVEPRSIPPAEVEATVEKNLEALENTTGGAVPTFSVKASPEAQAVARNPELGAKPTKENNTVYSRRRPTDPEVRAAVDKVIQPAYEGKGILQNLLSFMSPSTTGEYKSVFSKFRQGYINRYEPLEKMSQMMKDTLGALADTSAYFGIVMADRSSSQTASSIKHGVTEYDAEAGIFRTKDFMYTGKDGETKKVDGLLGVFEKLMPSENVYGENLMEVFQGLAIAKRAKEINDSGKLSPVPKGEEDAFLAEMEAMADKYINPETGESYVREAYDMYQAYNNEVIKLMKDSGLITDQEAISWERSSVYYPFYKDFDADPNSETNQETSDGKLVNVDSILNIGMENSPSFLPQEKIGSQKLRRLEGSRLKIDVPPLEAMVKNLDAAINMSMKNIAYQRAMRDAVYLGFASKIEPGRKMKALKKGEISNDIYIRENGKDVHYKVHDQLLFAALTPVADGSLVKNFTLVTSIPARFLRESVTRSPGFMGVNMLRDTLSAFVTSGASFTPVLDTAKNFMTDLTEFEKLGIVTGYDNINDPKDLAAFLSKQMRKKGIDTGASKGRRAWENSLGKAWDWLGAGTTKSDFATRKAVYDDVLARTGNQAEAMHQAIEVLNFGRRGGNAAYRMIAAATPFLNARIQGLDVLWRSGLGTYSSRSDLGKAQIQRNALLRASYLTALTAAYWMLVSDDDQYKEASDYIRDNNWLIPNPFGPNPIKIPIPFEIGLLFKTFPEKALDATFKDSTARDFTQTVGRGIGATLEANPLGMFQITAPIVEVAVNKNFYTGRQVVPYYIDQGLVAGLQDNVTTTQFAQWLGQSTGMSPLKIDHVLNGYAGSLGMLFLDTTDWVLRTPTITGDFSESMPTMSLAEHPASRRFFAREEGTGLAEDFYEMNRYVQQAVQTLGKLEDDGRIEEYQKFMYGREHLFELQKDFNKIKNELGEFREYRQAILRSDIHPDIKQQQIRELEAAQNEFLSIVPELKELVRLPLFGQLPFIGESTFKEGGP
jgi:hypothetical protein